MRFLVINGAPTQAGFLLLMEIRYWPFFFLMDALFIIMNGGPVLAGFLSSRPTVLPGLLLLIEARFCPGSYH